MRIILYSKIVRKVSGLHTFEKVLIEKLSKEHEFVYVYDAGDPHVIDSFKKLCKVVKNEGQIIRGDILIYSSVFQEENNIQVSSSIQIVHAELSRWGVKGMKLPNVDKYISVSSAVAKDLLENYGKESEVIPNLLGDVREERVLRFLTASRIDNGKGFERMKIMAERLKEANKPFVWEIYGDGSKMLTELYKESFKDIPEVVFMGSRTNIQAYMKGVDYVVQLSDSEGFCYSIHEALQIGTPVIVTDWEGVRDSIEDGLNGFIFDMEMNNFEANKLYEQFIACGKLRVTNNVLLWSRLFNFLEQSHE
jgi:glycosyltransferase involved in cell wall biosynthesis